MKIRNRSEIHHPQEAAQSPEARKALLLFSGAFIASYAYTLFPETEARYDFYPFVDGTYVDGKFVQYVDNVRAYAYYIGERLRDILHALAFFLVFRVWQFRAILILELAYLVDFLGWFNDSPYGRIKGLSYIAIAALTIFEWKKR